MEGFFADPKVGGEALRLSGIHAVGIANNVNYGAENIAASIARLDQLGIAHTGAGPNLAAARAPVIVARNGLRVGAVQRSSVYWPTDHEAHADSPGIAVILGHTAYHVPSSRVAPGVPPPNRPGVPPVIVTWADQRYLDEFRADIAALRPQVEIVVASCHWGLGREPLQYMTDIAHAAIDAGADIVVGHGPHFPLGIEIYKERPIFYSVGNLIFQNETVGFFPADAYERFDLDLKATPSDFLDARTNGGKKGHPSEPAYWENMFALCEFSRSKLTTIKIHPIDQGFGRARPQRGRPLLAEGEVANRVLGRVARLSKRYGSKVMNRDGVGTIEL